MNLKVQDLSKIKARVDNTGEGKAALEGGTKLVDLNLWNIQ